MPDLIPILRTTCGASFGHESRVGFAQRPRSGREVGANSYVRSGHVHVGVPDQSQDSRYVPAVPPFTAHGGHGVSREGRAPR